MSNKDLRAEIVGKALKDPAFKAALLKDPKTAVEKAIGMKVPDGVTVKIVEDSASTVHLVLPPAPAGGQLSDKDLSKVAGGLKCQVTTIDCPDNTRPW